MTEPAHAAGILYVIATPIGNLEDISLRALRLLEEADTVYCEDTRTTSKLLKHYKIQTPTKSYHTHSGVHKTQEIIERLNNGETLALVSDAGTPLLSDPGGQLIRSIREQCHSDVKISPIPGPSALATAISATGFHGSRFRFLGFLPQKKGRIKLLTEITTTTEPVIFYESRHRIAKLLDQLSEVSFAGKITLARELTKLHEEFIVGTVEEVTAHLELHPQSHKGEFVVILEPAS